MKKTLLIIIWSILMQLNVNAQTKTGIENYNFKSNSEPYLWMPIIHRTGKKGLHTEFRYNYEERKTASVYIGKNFSRDSVLSYSITPMLGWVFGKYNGASLALNADADYKKFFVSVQTQYTVSKDGAADNFFYTWAEAGYEPVAWFYAGVSTQLTKVYKEKNITEFGVLAGFNIKNITVPVYVFSPFSKERNFIAGINIEW
ncbi:MAG: hypothetical protein JNM14_05290 [Ferruginibacter sp.]|nr:hypothetical protein [Ferruginibacter sp.]